MPLGMVNVWLNLIRFDHLLTGLTIFWGAIICSREVMDLSLLGANHLAMCSLKARD